MKVIQGQLLKFAYLFSGALLLVSCGGSTPAGSTESLLAAGDGDILVTAGGSDFGPHANQTLWWSVTDSASASNATVTLGKGQVTVAASGVWWSEDVNLIADQTYYLNACADLNENGQQDAPPDDHCWQWPMKRSDSGPFTVNHSLEFKDVRDLL